MHTTLADLPASEREKISKFLKSHPVGVLATVDGNDPYASVIYFSVDDDLHITFTTKRDTAKYKNIARHNKVMMVTYDAISQTVVHISGNAVEVTDPAQQQAIYYGTLKAARQTSDDIVPPIAKLPAGPYVGFTIDIDAIWMNEYHQDNNFATAMQHVHDTTSSGDLA